MLSSENYIRMRKQSKFQQYDRGHDSDERNVQRCSATGHGEWIG